MDGCHNSEYCFARLTEPKWSASGSGLQATLEATFPPSLLPLPKASERAIMASQFAPIAGMSSNELLQRCRYQNAKRADRSEPPPPGLRTAGENDMT
jgi:hypothetical protein